jgi:PleD family two-component response regulator
MRVAIVSHREAELHDFARGLGSDLEWFADPGDLLAQAPDMPWNLVILDALLPGMEYQAMLQDLLRVNSLLHTAVIADMSETDLFAQCEGLGVLCAVPARPGWSDGARVMNQLCLFYDMG